MKRVFKLCLLLVLTMLLSACATSKNGEKIAVLDWQKAITQHPLQDKLKQEEKQLKLLVEKRKQQEKLAMAQLSSLSKLQGLKDASQRTYMSADFNTYMAEKQSIEQGRLISFTKKVDREGDDLVGERRKQVEEAYQLEMFNLKLKLETMKLSPEQRTSLENKFNEARSRRDRDMAAVEAEKHAYMQSKLQPYVAEMQKRLQQEAKLKQQDNQAKLEGNQEKYSKLMEAAPKALQNILAILDREIEKQQAKCDALKKQMGRDVESQVVKLAKERGYTIVFNTFKVNVKAEDITEQVLAALKKQK